MSLERRSVRLAGSVDGRMLYVRVGGHSSDLYSDADLLLAELHQVPRRSVADGQR